MIAIIRISGNVKIKEEFRETFQRLGLSRKFSCIVLEKPTEVELGMIKHVKDFIAFGELDDATYKKLVEIRGKKFKIAKNSKFEKENRRMVFRLHPARGGMNTKQHYSLEHGNIRRGVLGNHGKDINKLVEKML